MHIEGSGIDAHLPRLDGNLEVLEHDWTLFQRVGFDYVEIPVHGLDAILGGRLHERRVKEVQEIVERLEWRSGPVTARASGRPCRRREGSSQSVGSSR